MPWPTILVAALLMVAWFATEPSGQAEVAPTKRQKIIDFEDDVVEGMNKRPLDSLNQISEANRKRHKPHLYRRRGGFRSETAETLRALQYTP